MTLDSPVLRLHAGSFAAACGRSPGERRGPDSGTAIELGRPPGVVGIRWARKSLI
jgi:hypothetical protein